MIIWTSQGPKDLKKKNNIKFYNLDLTKKNSLKIFNKIDYVIHLASMTNAAGSFKKKNEMYKNNINCMKNIINFCKKRKAKLIHISSTSVYGKQTSIVDENCEKKFLNPQSPYAASKVAAEALCISYYYTYGSNVRVIRNFNTFGPRQKSSGYGSVISIFCRRALDNKPLIIYGDGEQTRDYQYIDDAIEGYLLSEALPAGEIVNTGFGVDHKIIDIGKAIIDICNSKSSIVFADPRPGEVHKLRSNIDKLKSYGFMPENSLRDGLEKYIEWLQKYDLDSLGVMK